MRETLGGDTARIDGAGGFLTVALGISPLSVPHIQSLIRLGRRPIPRPHGRRPRQISSGSCVHALKPFAHRLVVRALHRVVAPEAGATNAPLGVLHP